MASEITTVLASLKAFGATIAGIKKSFGIDDLPEKIGSRDSQLPCLIVVPEIGNDQGYGAQAMMGNAPALKIEVTHLLLYAESSNLPTIKVLPGLIAMVDAYNAAAKAAPFLTYTTSPKTQQLVMGYTVFFEQGTFAGISFHTVRFVHKMTMQL